jgi:translation elongation factor EF-1alpha
MGTIVVDKIEPGCCRVGDRCVIMPNWTRIEVTYIYYEDSETDSCIYGENVRLKFKNVAEVCFFFLLINISN